MPLSTVHGNGIPESILISKRLLRALLGTDDIHAEIVPKCITLVILDTLAMVNAT
jgi:hypothetical protein